MNISSRITAASAFFLAIALFYAPLAYGCTRPEMLPALFELLTASIVTGVIGFAAGRRWPAIPGLALTCVAAILLQGWWMTWDPVFPSADSAYGEWADTSLDNIRRLSFDFMTSTSFLLGAFVVLRREPGTELPECRVKHESRVGRVVMGDDHDRAIGIGVAGLRHDVIRRPARQHPAHPATALAEVVPQPCGGDPRRRSGGEPGAPASAAQRHDRRRGSDPFGQTDRPPVAAVRAPLLDLGLAPERAQMVRDRLGRDPLTLRRRRPLHPRELIDRPHPSFVAIHRCVHGAVVDHMAAVPAAGRSRCVPSPGGVSSGDG